MKTGDKKITRLCLKNTSLFCLLMLTNKGKFGKLVLLEFFLIGFVDMSQHPEIEHRILIASANALFGEGLYKMYAHRWSEQGVDVFMAKTMLETLNLLDSHRPDLVIVDYDDKTINREEFLNRFVSGEIPMKVILVSLASSEPIVIYNRVQMTAIQAEGWLANPWDE